MKQQTTNNEQQVVETKSLVGTKSGLIRQLSSEGMKRGDIVRHFKVVYGIEIRYQHVRNVLVTPLKKEEVK